MASSIEYLGRQVRFKVGYAYGYLGPNGQQIGRLKEVKEGDIGTVTSHKPGLTVQLADGSLVRATKDNVDLLPR